MVRRRLSLKETTSTFMLNLQNHRQCPAGGFLLLAGRRRPGWLRDSLKAGSGIGQRYRKDLDGGAGWRGDSAPRLSRRTTASCSPSSKPRFQSSHFRRKAFALGDGPRHRNTTVPPKKVGIWQPYGGFIYMLRCGNVFCSSFLQSEKRFCSEELGRFHGTRPEMTEHSCSILQS
jgi:hypothetical protein